jgi:hypothetical protein
MKPRKVPLRKILEEVINPYESDVWNMGFPIQQEQVTKAIREQRFEPIPYDGEDFDGKDHRNYDHHARIAYLVVNPTKHPILVRVNNILGDGVVILDGCHRIAAAFYRGDDFMMVDYDGSTEGLRNWIRN